MRSNWDDPASGDALERAARHAQDLRRSADEAERRALLALQLFRHRQIGLAVAEAAALEAALTRVAAATSPAARAAHEAQAALRDLDQG